MIEIWEILIWCFLILLYGMDFALCQGYSTWIGIASVFQYQEQLLTAALRGSQRRNDVSFPALLFFQARSGKIRELVQFFQEGISFPSLCLLCCTDCSSGQLNLCVLCIVSFNTLVAGRENPLGSHQLDQSNF